MEVFVGDTVTLILNTGIDISSYVTKRIKYKKPDETTGYWTSSICPTDNNCMIYECGTTDLNDAGKWQVQAYIAGGGYVFHGMWADLKVYDPLV